MKIAILALLSTTANAISMRAASKFTMANIETMWKILDDDKDCKITLQDVEEKGYEVCLEFRMTDLDKCKNSIKAGLGKKGNDVNGDGFYDIAEFYASVKAWVRDPNAPDTMKCPTEKTVKEESKKAIPAAKPEEEKKPESKPSKPEGDKKTTTLN